MKAFFMSILLLLLPGCFKDAANTPAFHLGTGVTLISASECDHKQIGRPPVVNKSGKGYVVSIYDARVCNAKTEHPSLSLTRSKKVTLDVGDSSCECARSIQVGLEDRLESGDVLYVLNGGEVSGHLQVP
jgi:hypothetical protein